VGFMEKTSGSLIYKSNPESLLGIGGSKSVITQEALAL
jgi:hypothetical protein